jgi:hypothetical protein
LTTENFHKNKNRPLGFEYKCKDCAKKRTDRRIKRYENFTPEIKFYNKPPLLKRVNQPDFSMNSGFLLF